MGTRIWILAAAVIFWAMPAIAFGQLEKGIQLFEKAEVALQQKQRAPAAQLYRQAISAFDAGIAAEDNSYEAHDYKARAYEALEEPQGAYNAYRQGVAVFERVVRPTPDLYAPTMCLHMASIAKENPLRMREALADLYRGEGILQQEWRKAQSQRGNFSHYNWESFAKQYHLLLHAFQSLEIDLIAADPSLLNDALPQYAERYRQQPNNEVVALAYAAMLQEANPDEALKLYQTLLTNFPNSADVRYCLSVFLERVAEGYYLSYEVSANDQIYQQFQRCYREAYEMMQAAYAIRPGKGDILDALVRMSSDLGDEAYPFYKATKQIENGN